MSIKHPSSGACQRKRNRGLNTEVRQASSQGHQRNLSLARPAADKVMGLVREIRPGTARYGASATEHSSPAHTALQNAPALLTNCISISVRKSALFSRSESAWRKVSSHLGLPLVTGFALHSDPTQPHKAPGTCEVPPGILQEHCIATGRQGNSSAKHEAYPESTNTIQNEVTGSAHLL